ncbi:hypothetical protein C789_4320 [Microcystis aeruginosa FACHB-905 = DIANCHI905]|nr:hypothetical protein C789_4320 [Microcystis aeruginosa FACHB-905 = DIANCHI905]
MRYLHTQDIAFILSRVRVGRGNSEITPTALKANRVYATD